MDKIKTFSVLTSERYIKDNLEDGSIITYLDIPEGKSEHVYYDELPDTEIKGYPFCSDFVSKEGKIYSTDEFLALSDRAKKNCSLRKKHD